MILSRRKLFALVATVVLLSSCGGFTGYSRCPISTPDVNSDGSASFSGDFLAGGLVSFAFISKNKAELELLSEATSIGVTITPAADPNRKWTYEGIELDIVAPVGNEFVRAFSVKSPGHKSGFFHSPTGESIFNQWFHVQVVVNPAAKVNPESHISLNSIETTHVTFSEWCLLGFPKLSNTLLRCPR